MSVASRRRAIRTARLDEHAQVLADVWADIPHTARTGLALVHPDLYYAVEHLTAHQQATSKQPTQRSPVMDRIAPYWKAVVGFITPGVVGLVAAVQNGSPGGRAVTGPEWVGIGAACILTGGAVFNTKNTPVQD